MSTLDFSIRYSPSVLKESRIGTACVLCLAVAIQLSSCEADEEGLSASSPDSGNAPGSFDGGGTGPAFDCIGVRGEPAVSPQPADLDAGGDPEGADAAADTAASDASLPDASCSTCPGARAPEWQLVDFQPQSCGFGKTYGLEQFRGHTTVVGLFSGWCDFCQAQTVELERMRQELRMEGHDVQFLLINSDNARNDQQALIDRCAFPLFQDTTEVNAFALHGGAKDDLIVYDRNGRLSAFLPGSGAAGPTVLMSPPGYENVKSKILAAE